MTEPRLLAGLSGSGPMSLARHVATHGELPAVSASGRPAFLAEVTASGLRGRGGAGFPAGVKGGAVAGQRPPVVIINGSESEPMSSKDRVLLTHTPHLVIDGAQIAAETVAAREVILVAAPEMLPFLRLALEERRATARPETRLRLLPGGSGYVAGEETALIAHVEGRLALPRVKPPLPVEKGLRGRPTLVHNVETIAQLALVARHGAEWFRAEGTRGHPGTTLVTVSGAVAEPGVYEVPLGIPLSQLPGIAGGALEPIRALLVGGYFGAWVDADGTGITLDEASLRDQGASVGAGVIVVLGQSACPVAETARLAAWMSAESAGQCGPCIHGLASLAEVLQRIAGGRTHPGDIELLTRWGKMIQGRGACRHPDGVVRMIASATRVFPHELVNHARGRPCRSCDAPATLLTPERRRRAA